MKAFLFIFVCFQTWIWFFSCTVAIAKQNRKKTTVYSKVPQVAEQLLPVAAAPRCLQHPFSKSHKTRPLTLVSGPWRPNFCHWRLSHGGKHAAKHLQISGQHSLPQKHMLYAAFRKWFQKTSTCSVSMKQGVAPASFIESARAPRELPELFWTRAPPAQES